MYGLYNFLEAIDQMLNTRRKRHAIGGILLSFSLLFGGLSATVMTMSDDSDISESDFDEIY